MALNTLDTTLGSGEACAEVTMSRRLAGLAADALAEGFPFVAEHLKHLALYVLDEAAYAKGMRPTVEDDPDLA